MGRNRKQGLDYFPFDVDFFSDLKIRKLIKCQGGKAVTVYALLLCNIYKQGYYMRWDKELPFIISEQTGYDEVYIQEVIKSCFTVGLFSKDLYDQEKVITSKGIQERYQSICSLSRRVCDIKEYNLISSEKNVFSSEEKAISSEEKGITSEEKPISSAKSTQRKEKEINKENTTNVVSKKGKHSLSQNIDFEELKNYFNSTFNGKIQQIKVITEKRKKAVKARVAEFGKESIITVFKNVQESKYLLGNNNNNWRCDFDWIFAPTNYVRILEGNYKNRSYEQKQTEYKKSYDNGDYLE